MNDARVRFTIGCLFLFQICSRRSVRPRGRRREADALFERQRAAVGCQIEMDEERAIFYVQSSRRIGEASRSIEQLPQSGEKSLTEARDFDDNLRVCLGR